MRKLATIALAFWLLAATAQAQSPPADLVDLQRQKIALLEERVSLLEELADSQQQTIKRQDMAIAALTEANEAWREVAGSKKGKFWPKTWLGFQIAVAVATIVKLQ